MRRNYTMLTLRLILVGMIGLGLIGLIGCGQQGSPGGAKPSITASAQDTYLPPDGTSSTTISATLTDSKGVAVTKYTKVSFKTDLGTFEGGKTEMSVRTQDDSGQVQVPFIAGTKSGIANITISSQDVTQHLQIKIGATSVGSLTLTSGTSEITADGKSTTIIQAEVSDPDNHPAVGFDVTFKATFGQFKNPEYVADNDDGTGNADTAGHSKYIPSLTVKTDIDGKAVAMLTSDTRTGVALVSAATAGFSDQLTVNFVPGPPVDKNSSITANPVSIPPDGTSTTKVTVTLADANGNPISNGTEVSLYASAGTITSTNPAATSSGRATFELTAADSPGPVTLSLPEYPDIASKKITFGSIGSGNPASVLVESIGHPEIAVTGVGQNDNTAVRVRIVDEAGVTIKDADEPTETQYFLTVSLLARPQGGELLGGELNGSPVSDSQKISISTTDGQATFNLRSGILPGVVEVRVEVTTKNDTVNPNTYDNSLSPAVVTVIPQISIDSGPPHTIALSAPRLNAVINLNNGADSGIPQTPGFYSRKAGLIVTDQYGNAVPDGTVVNLGLIDTVIASSITGKTEGNSNELKDVGGIIDFTKASVIRNGAPRSILPHDRVVIFNANAEDKSRFVSTGSITVNTLPVTKAYVKSYSNLNYAVGSSLLGGAIYGIDNSSGTSVATKGTVKTQNGLAELRLVYPANSNTIHNGSYKLGVDKRVNPASSARVISVFTSSDGGATLVDEGTLTFASIVPWKLTAVPTATSTTSTTVTLTLVDGGDQVPLPFIPVTTSIVITSATTGVTSPLVISAAAGTTVADSPGTPAGTATSAITVTTPGNSGDKAVITYSAGGGTATATATVTYTEP